GMDAARIRGDFHKITCLSDGREHDNRYLSLLGSYVPHDAKRVLDIGFGLGLLTARLASRDRHITGVDLSPEMIARARKKSTDAWRFLFLCGDFLEQGFTSEQFDCVISAATLHHMPTTIAVPRMMELVRPGGRLIIHDVRRDEGLYDQIRSHFALAQEASLRLLRTGSPRSPRAVRLAWERHCAGEKYLTFREARVMPGRYLPPAALFDHWLWRYTIVWNKPCAA